jgi:hypothetical protein
MINFSNLYENTLGPLIIAKELYKGSLYITEDGTRIRYLDKEEGSLSFEIDTNSPLKEGVLISELNQGKGGLPMFWKLLNKINHYYEDSNY